MEDPYYRTDGTSDEVYIYWKYTYSSNPIVGFNFEYGRAGTNERDHKFMIKQNKMIETITDTSSPAETACTVNMATANYDRYIDIYIQAQEYEVTSAWSVPVQLDKSIHVGKKITECVLPPFAKNVHLIK